MSLGRAINTHGVDAMSILGTTRTPARMTCGRSRQSLGDVFYNVHMKRSLHNVKNCAIAACRVFPSFE